MTSMRAATGGFSKNIFLGKQQQIKATKAQRRVFKWLPSLCANDMVEGSWWYVWCCVASIIAPIIPVIGLYENFWPVNTNPDGKPVVPFGADVVQYILLVVSGSIFTIASYLLVRAFRIPIPAPIIHSEVLYFSTDELMSTWLYLVGAIPFIPVMGIYVSYNPSDASYWILLFGCMFGILIAAGIIVALCPQTEAEMEGTAPKNYLSPHVQRYVPCASIHEHIANDWLLMCWVLTLGSLVSVIICALVLIMYSVAGDMRGIIDWVFCWLKCFFLWLALCIGLQDHTTKLFMKIPYL